MSLQRIVINTDLTADGFKSQCNLAPGQLPALNNLIDYLAALAGGNQMASLACAVGAVQATGKLTVATGGSTAAQACTVANVTLTGVASNPAANEFVVSATEATQAQNMVNAINASASLAGKVTAARSGNDVVITAVIPGLSGNGLQLSAGNLANVTATAFGGVGMTAGSDGTTTTLSMGK